MGRYVRIITLLLVYWSITPDLAFADSNRDAYISSITKIASIIIKRSEKDFQKYGAKLMRRTRVLNDSLKKTCSLLRNFKEPKTPNVKDAVMVFLQSFYSCEILRKAGGNKYSATDAKKIAAFMFNHSMHYAIEADLKLLSFKAKVRKAHSF